MNKTYKFNKIIYSIIFSIVTMLVFLINFGVPNLALTPDNTPLTQFFLELNISVKGFDIIYVTLYLFILYFYYHTYFDGTKYDKKDKKCTVLAIVFVVISLISKSYSLNNNLELLYCSSVQVLKTIIFGLGYYLIYYAIFKKIFNLELNIDTSKKKLHFSKNR